jgi:hypothetical protein
MSESKTNSSSAPVIERIDSEANETRPTCSYVLLDLLQKTIGQHPLLWRNSVLGSENYPYKYDSDREGVFFLAGFSPRKQNLVLYTTGSSRNHDLVEKSGRYKTGKSCLYINQLSDINLTVLKEPIQISFEDMKTKYDN